MNRFVELLESLANQSSSDPQAMASLAAELTEAQARAPEILARHAVNKETVERWLDQWFHMSGSEFTSDSARQAMEQFRAWCQNSQVDDTWLNQALLPLKNWYTTAMRMPVLLLEALKAYVTHRTPQEWFYEWWHTMWTEDVRYSADVVRRWRMLSVYFASSRATSEDFARHTGELRQEVPIYANQEIFQEMVSHPLATDDFLAQWLRERSVILAPWYATDPQRALRVTPLEVIVWAVNHARGYGGDFTEFLAARLPLLSTKEAFVVIAHSSPSRPQETVLPMLRTLFARLSAPEKARILSNPAFAKLYWSAAPQRL